MNAFIVDALVFLAELGGFTALLLAMPRHHQDWLGSKLPPIKGRSVRLAGFALLAVGTAFACAGHGWGYGGGTGYRILDGFSSRRCCGQLQSGADPRSLEGNAVNRSSLISRMIAGTLGAYVATALVTIALSRLIILLGGDPVEATLGATLVSFALFAGVTITVFHAKPARAWFWLLLVSMAICLFYVFL